MMVLLALVALATTFIGKGVQDKDTRNVVTGITLGSTSNSYYDQPQIVILPSGVWVCVLTSGPDKEGQPSENVYIQYSHDFGKTWGTNQGSPGNGEIRPLEPEHPYGPPAAWVNPLLTSYGRLYIAYTYNIQNITTMPGSQVHRRSDTVGIQAMRYSDDGGITWSERFEMPTDVKDIDKNNELHGAAKEGWSVGKPFTVTQGGKSVTYFQFCKRACGLLNPSQCPASQKIHAEYVPMQEFVIVSDNIDYEKNVSKLHFSTEPTGPVGLLSKADNLTEEGNLIPLPNFGDVYYTMRTFDGYVGVAHYINGIWTDKLRAMYREGRPGSMSLKQPNGPLSPRKFTLSNGDDVYLLLYYNRGLPDATGQASWGLRNPYWLVAGWDSNNSNHIEWGQPEVILYELSSSARLGYPDLFRDENGRYYATETDKVTARLHPLDSTLVENLIHQGTNSVPLPPAEKDYKNPPSSFPSPPLPDVANGEGLTMYIQMEFGENLNMLKTTSTNVSFFNCGDALDLTYVADEGTVTIKVTDGIETWSLTSDDDLVPAHGNHSLLFNIDGAGKLMHVMIDGFLCDGGLSRGQGFFFNPVAKLGKLSAETCSINSNGFRLTQIQTFARSLSTSEMLRVTNQ
eukprot:m.87386 g.87386  ORF g.87386 m.87386 type:complete len:626 (-) comp13105_c0_seq3:158-2035(-)